MKLHHSSALTNVGCSQTSAAATNQEQLREPTQTSKKCSQGALQLAAIVHYDSLASYCPAAAAGTSERSCSRATSASSSSSRQAGANNKSHVSLSPPDRLQAERRGECDTKSGEQQVVVLANTHEESGDRVEREKKQKKSSSKFSRLFFTKNKSKQQLPSMIDNRDADDSPHHAPSTTSEGHPSDGVRSGAAAAAAMSQVIEFKFDLIVEGERRDETPRKVDDDDEDDDEKLNDDKLPGHSLATTPGQHRKILRPIQQRKLLDQVNELVESFVLDSMDVCLMTIGRAHSRESTTSTMTFEYLLQSAELSLTYAFQLLAAVGPRSSRRTLVAATAECSPLRVDEHSIELEALLFVEQHAREPLQVVDMSANFARDCSSARQAMDLIKQIEVQLANQKSSATALMINLKLKQQVQGGLFTNRMCLLDLGERPGSSQLRPVLESIFSGQALAYLKTQKVRLHELEVALAISGPAGENDSSDEQIDNKHHHHNAYTQLTKLNQAEWLVYKQLSSALIKSLMIVHCRRLAPSPASGSGSHREQVKSIEAHLMDYNLNLLEFASAIKRASASRLKRRKRHLRSHLTNQTTGSNLSLASDLTPNNHYKQSYESSPSSQHHHHDLMISSPFRHAKTMAHRHHYHHHHNHRPCCESPPPAQLPVLPAHLIDRYNRRHCSSSSSRKRHRHHHHHKHQHDSSGGCHKCSRHAAGRAASLNRRRSHDLLGVGAPLSLSSSLCRHCDELETSSQMSTSSGSQRTSSMARRQLDVDENRCAIDLDDLNDSLATTTLHGGNLGARHQRHHGRSGSSSIRDGAGPAASSVASWAARARRQLQQRALDLQRSSPSEQSAGGTLDDSIELQSFRSSSSSVVTATPAQVGAGAHLLCQRTGGNELQQLDDMIPDPPSPLEAPADSDLGHHHPPVVAEPPRQLKLEKFLNQLTSAIGGGGGGQLPVAGPPQKQSSRQQEDEDEDEDCRSHSSILEHLSSLALESNLKMVKQQQQQRVRAPSESRVSIVSTNEAAQNQPTPRWPLENANGHLQQLLKSTLKLHQQSQQRQSPLTIDCGAVHDSSESGATQPALSDSPRRSIESGCSSSSSGASSSSTSSGRHATGGLEQQQQCLASKTATANLNSTQLYTSVIRQNT